MCNTDQDYNHTTISCTLDDMKKHNNTKPTVLYNYKDPRPNTTHVQASYTKTKTIECASIIYKDKDIIHVQKPLCVLVIYASSPNPRP